MREEVNYAGKTIRMNNNSVLCDPEKLGECLKQRGLTWNKASAEVGYTDRALQTAAKAGVLSRTIVKGLEIRFNIKLEDYQFVPKKPEKEDQETDQGELPGQVSMDDVINEQNGLSPQELTAIIRSAIEDAISAQIKPLRGIIIGAVAANRDVFHKAMLDAIMDSAQLRATVR